MGNYISNQEVDGNEYFNKSKLKLDLDVAKLSPKVLVLEKLLQQKKFVQDNNINEKYINDKHFRSFSDVKKVVDHDYSNKINKSKFNNKLSKHYSLDKKKQFKFNTINTNNDKNTIDISEDLIEQDFLIPPKKIYNSKNFKVYYRPKNEKENSRPKNKYL